MLPPAAGFSYNKVIYPLDWDTVKSLPWIGRNGQPWVERLPEEEQAEDRLRQAMLDDAEHDQLLREHIGEEVLQAIGEFEQHSLRGGAIH